MTVGSEDRVPKPQGSGKPVAYTPPILPLDAPLPWGLHIAAGPGDALVIAFASVGHDPTRIPSPEFVGSATAGGRPALFISDESRSWGNAPDFAEMLTAAVDQVKSRQRIRRTLLIGQSMGAFCALVAAGLIPTDAVLAIGPQFSVDPSVMREERWAGWTRRIPAFRHPTAPLPEGPRITLMHGMEDDMPQAMAFPQRKGVDHILFPGLAHSALAPHLKARGCLPGLIESALAGDRRRLLRIASGAGGQRRDQLPR